MYSTSPVYLTFNNQTLKTRVPASGVRRPAPSTNKIIDLAGVIWISFTERSYSQPSVVDARARHS